MLNCENQFRISQSLFHSRGFSFPVLTLVVDRERGLSGVLSPWQQSWFHKASVSFPSSPARLCTLKWDGRFICVRCSWVALTASQIIGESHRHTAVQSQRLLCLRCLWCLRPFSLCLKSLGCHVPLYVNCLVMSTCWLLLQRQRWVKVFIFSVCVLGELLMLTPLAPGCDQIFTWLN